jgi:quaternary ammonium compound-resistance protein SugE
MKAWAYIFLAAVFEVVWAFSLKHLSKDKIFSAVSQGNYFNHIGADAFLPLAGYIVFGLINVYFISLAFKEMPISIAFAAWTGLALIFNVLLDSFYFKVYFSTLHFLYIAMIVGGIIGLKSITIE